MSYICKVLYTLPGSGQTHQLKWMNTKPEIAVYKTLKKYKAAQIVDTITYEPVHHKHTPSPPEGWKFTSFDTIKKNKIHKVLREGIDTDSDEDDFDN